MSILFCLLGVYGQELLHKYDFNDGTALDSVSPSNDGKLGGGAFINDGLVQFLSKSDESTKPYVQLPEGILGDEVEGNVLKFHSSSV